MAIFYSFAISFLKEVENKENKIKIKINNNKVIKMT